MRILIVEDMAVQRNTLREQIENGFLEKRAAERDVPSVTAVATEEEFYEWHKGVVEGGEAPPDMVIFDIMLPFRRLREEDFGPNARPVPESGPINEAGFRCAKRLMEHPKTSHVRFFFHSALPRDVVAAKLEQFPGVIHRTKDNDARGLMETVERLLGESRAGAF